jgi:hypothetical protein
MNLNSYPELQKHYDDFLHSLKRRDSVHMESLWDNHLLLRRLFMGKKVNLGRENNPDWQVISTETLVMHFTLALGSHSTSIVRGMWDESKTLRITCINLQNYSTSDQAVALLRIVLQCNIKSFINEYLKTVKTPQIIRSVIEFTRMKYQFKQSEYSRSQLYALEKRLHEIESSDDITINNELPIPATVLISSAPENIKLSSKKRNNHEIQDYDFPCATWEDEADNDRPEAPKIQKKTAILTGVIVADDAYVLNNNSPMSGAVIETPIIIPQTEMKEPEYVSSSSSMAHAEEKSNETSLDEPLSDIIPAFIVLSNDQSQSEKIRQLIAEFKALLLTMDKTNIYKKWNENLILQNLLCSVPVNFGSQSRPHFKIIPFVELYDIFILVLKSCCNDILELMWTKSSLFPNWFSGQKVNFGCLENPNLRVISLASSIIVFQDALTAKTPYLLYSLFMLNDKFKYWLSGDTFNSGPSNLPLINAITIDKSIAIFKLTLSSELKDFIHIVWRHNKKLRRWCLNEETNFGCNLLPDKRKLLFDELIEIFILLFKSQCPHIIKEIWNANEELRTWCHGEPKNFGSNHLDDLHFIPFEQLTSLFQMALELKMDYIYGSILVSNSYLRDWYSGNSVGDDTLSNVITLRESILIFELAIKCKAVAFIEFLWSNNKILQSWYTSKPVNAGSQTQPILKIISVDELNRICTAINLLGLKRITHEILVGNPPLEQICLSMANPVATSIPANSSPTYQAAASMTFFGNPHYDQAKNSVRQLTPADRDFQRSHALISRGPF